MDNYIKVSNYGDFTIRFSVIYYADGKRYAKRSSAISRYVTKGIKIPSNATSIQVNVEIARPQAKWDKFYHKSISTSKNVCLQVGGYNYKPRCAEIKC